MKIQLTEKDIKILETKDGFSYRIKEIEVCEIPTKELALESAERTCVKLLKDWLKK